MHLPTLRGDAPRRRRAWLTAAALGLTAIVAPLAAPSPAGAVNAPLLTEDGLGIRVDENALLGPALEAIETAMQPFVDDMIRDGAIDGAPLGGYHALYTQGNLELGLDFLAPGSGRPSGAVKVHADILNIELQYRRKAWWHADCGVWVRPDNATIDITANVDAGRLPNTPLALQPIQATWDDDPSVSTSGMCWTYLIDDFFNKFAQFFTGSNPESTASRIEAQLNGVAQDLLDDVWGDNVVPVLDSLTAFGITPATIKTDDHGLIVTADVDASAGLTIPGIGGPYNVTNAQESGADNDVLALLSNRDEIIVTVHPNVANQFLYALNTSLNSLWGSAPVASSIENVLLLPANQAAYPDANWTVKFRIQSTVPYTTPDPTTGAPKLQLPTIQMQFFNGSPLIPVATFTGSMSDVALVTEVRSGSTSWGPGFDPAGASLNVTRTQANTHAALVAPQASSAILPYAKTAIDFFNDTLFVQYVSLAPISIYGFNISLCTTCGRYSGDERYTETFRVA